MDVVLRPETQRLLEERMKTGEYTTPEDVVHAALLALGELARIGPDDETLDAIDRAEDQIERGECREWKDVYGNRCGRSSSTREHASPLSSS